MALSRVIRTGNGTTTQFVVDFALGYLDQADVTARVGDEVDGAGNPVYRTITFLSDTLMQISGPPAGNGVRVVFERTVEKEDTLVHFSNGDVMDEENLDLSFKQILMVVHEVLDGRLGQFNNDLDMGGFRIGSLGDPLVASDAANKRYVDSRIETSQNNATASAASAAAAAASANLSGSHATASALSATASEASRQAALVQAIRSSEFADASEASSTSSGLYANASAESRDNAFKWSSEQEDVQVNDGIRTGFSAYHWARKAAQSIGGVSSWVGLTGTISKLQASTALSDTFVSLDGSAQMTGKLQLIQSVGGSAALNIPHGSTPTAPQNGDMWTTTSGLVVRVNGTASTLWGTHNMAIGSQTEAEAGTSNTVRGWSSLRISQAIAAQAKDPMPIGSVLMLYGNDSVAPDGYLLANGAAVTSAYPALRAHGLSRGWPVNGNGDPVLPDFGGYFPRGWRTGQTVDSGRVFGTTQQDALQNITGGLGGRNEYYGGGGTGAFAPTGEVAGARADQAGPARGFTFDASRVARTSTETRPSNITVTYWIKAFSAGQTSGTADLTQLANNVAALQLLNAGVKRGGKVVPSGTSVLYTGIPAGVSKFVVHYERVLFSANSEPFIRIGGASGVVSSGYVGQTTAIQSNVGYGSTPWSSAVRLINDASGADVTGQVLFTRVPGTNSWTVRGNTSLANIDRNVYFMGRIALSEELDRFQFSTPPGTAVLSGNNIWAEWEF